MTDELMTKEQIAEEIEKLEGGPTRLAQLKAAAEFYRFLENNPSFYDCPGNVETIVDWLERNKLLPTVTNYELALKVATNLELLIEKPAAVPAEPELTLDDIERMTSTEYRRRLQRDPGFAAKVDALEKTRKPRQLGLNRAQQRS